MNLSLVNVWAILVAAISAFVIGGLWYSPALFGRAWERANGFAESPKAQPKVFVLSFLFSLLMAVKPWEPQVFETLRRHPDARPFAGAAG